MAFWSHVSSPHSSSHLETADRSKIRGRTPLQAVGLTPWSRIILEKIAVGRLVKNSPVFYGTLRFITCLYEPATGPYPVHTFPTHSKIRFTTRTA
jgi:hypothetical protein